MLSLIDAQTIAEALGGKRYGKGWRACCPAHGSSNPTSLSITDGDNGMVLVHCFGGCPPIEVIAELASRELWPEPTQKQKQYRANRVHLEKVEHAKTIIMLAEGDNEKAHSERDKQDIAAARKLLSLPEAKSAIIQPEPIPANDSWIFDFHCTTLNGVALNFNALDGDAKAVSFFNAAIQSPRGKRYPTGRGGQFIPRKRSNFRKFWIDTFGEEPYRWCLAHRYMKNVFAGLVITGEVVTAINAKGKPYIKLTNVRTK